MAEYSPLLPPADTHPLDLPGVKDALWVNILCGLAYGCSNGLTSVLFQYNQYLSDCSRNTAAGACNSLTDFIGCRWVDANSTTIFSNSSSRGGLCAFSDYETIDCGDYFHPDSCGDVSACRWHYHDKLCKHRVGWGATDQGIIAGAYVVGSMISSVFAGAMADKFGRRASLLITAIISIVGCVLFTVAWQLKQSFGLVIAAQIFTGMGAGLQCVVGPIYTEVVSSAKMKNVCGVSLQLFCALGSALTGIAALIVSPASDTGFEGISRWRQDSFQIPIGTLWITSLVLVPLAYFVSESEIWLASPAGRAAQKRKPAFDDAEPDERENGAVVVNKKMNSNVAAVEPVVVEQEDGTLFQRSNLVPLACAAVIGLSVQLTGVNAFIFYAPVLLSGPLGLEPLAANVMVQCVNFVASIPAPFAAKRFSSRKLFLYGMVVATVACAVNGIAIFPGILPNDSDGQHALSLVSTVVFFLGFEELAPAFYVLASTVFPTNVRSHGTAWTLWVGFAGSLLLNVGFPIAVQGISGGPSGNQNLGLSATYFIFAGVGLVSVTFLTLVMPKTEHELQHDEEHAQEKEQQQQSVEQQPQQQQEVRDAGDV